MSKDLDPNMLSFFSDAFRSFDLASEKLADAYAELEKKLENVNRELEQANQELSQSLSERKRLHDHLACVLGSMTTAVVAVDLDGKITLFNRSAEELMGINSEETIGKSYEKLFPDRPFLLETLEQHKPHRGRKGFIKRASQEEAVPIELATNIIANSEGEVLGALELIHDISEQKELEEQLARSKSLAELGRMAAEVAHDFRNPLGAIRLYAGMLQQELSDDRKQLADALIRGLDSLEAITYNLLSLARPIKPHFQFIDLAMLIDDVVELTCYTVEEKAIGFHRDYESDGELICYGDFEQLKQVLINLVLNAIQAMPNGGKLSLRASVHEERDLLIFSCEDNGDGIPIEIQEKIFTPFFTTKASGTGLGLHTVSRIIQAHLGRIRVESHEDRGTKFLVELPRSADRHKKLLFDVEKNE